MQEIEAGKYVRTESGNIGIFKRYTEEGVRQWFEMLQNSTLYTSSTKSIEKHSNNISDLLEKADMLKIDAGFREYIFYITEINDKEIIDGISRIDKNSLGNDFIIKSGAFTGCKYSIVTKQQFERIEYKI